MPLRRDADLVSDRPGPGGRRLRRYVASRQGRGARLGIGSASRAAVRCLHRLRDGGDDVADWCGFVGVDGGRLWLSDGDGWGGCCHWPLRALGGEEIGYVSCIV